MITIRAVGRIFYRSISITFLFIIAANIFPNTSTGYNSLVMGLVVGVLGAILSEVYKPEWA